MQVGFKGLDGQLVFVDAWWFRPCASGFVVSFPVDDDSVSSLDAAKSRFDGLVAEDFSRGVVVDGRGCSGCCVVRSPLVLACC